MRFVLFFLLCAVTALGQTFRGAISGDVVDASGAAIPEAIVKAENPATGFARSTITSQSGTFSIPELPLGTYRVTVTKTGFQSFQAESVEVAVSSVANLTVRLGVAQQSAIVEVSAAVAQVDTTSTALVGVVNTKTVLDLPLNGRDFRQMLRLSPGVTPGNNVNGNRYNNYQIDGADNNDAFHNTSAVNQGGVSGIAGTLLPVEAIDQFAVQTAGAADTGRAGGGAVNLVIKSGTNQMHGSAYYFNRNEYFAAKSPVAAPGTPKRRIRNEQYGFSVGGPIIRNKLFYFATGEAQKAIAAVSQLATHPSDAWVAQAREVMDRYSIPVNSAMANVRSFWPSRANNLPATANNFLASDNNDYDSYNGIVKLDYNLNDRNNISGRYFGGTGAQTALVNANSPYREYFQVAPSRMHNVSIVMNNVLSPQLVHQTLLGVNYFLQTFNDEDTSPNPVAAGLNTGVTEPGLLGSPTIDIAGFTRVGATQPLGRIDTTGHIVESLNWTTGRHQWKFGAEYRRAHLDIFYQTNKRGSFVFDGTAGPWRNDATVSAPLRALSDFLAGYTTSNSGARITRGDLQRDYRQNSFDWWAHDTVQLTSNLTVNYGVRYTYQGTLYDTENSITTFIPGRGMVAAGADIDHLYPRDWNNFAPRMGFAWTPFKGGTTVLRGSWGIFYDVPAINFFSTNSFANGGAAGVNANPGGPSPVYAITLNTVQQIQPGVPIFGTATPTPPFGVFSVSQDFRTPYVQNYTLNVQQQLGAGSVLQVAYVGSKGTMLPLVRNINAPLAGTAAIQTRRPFFNDYPTLAAINQAETIGNSNYNSLQTSYRLTLWNGLSAQAAYTWSKSIDNGTGVRSVLPANSYDLSRERGPADIDFRHIFTNFISYTVPNFLPALPRLGGGWQLNAYNTFYTGSPLDIRAGTNVSGTADGADRVDLVGDPFSGIVQPTTGTARRYFNAAAFARPATGEFGNIGRNAIYGPGFGATDFSVFKTTPITERVSAQFRVEIFNLFNRTNWANPGTSLQTATSFGLLTNTRNGASAPGLGQGEPRNVQLALKLIF
jgi:outer membrane receptor protein involved in Fe transport